MRTSYGFRIGSRQRRRWASTSQSMAVVDARSGAREEFEARLGAAVSGRLLQETRLGVGQSGRGRRKEKKEKKDKVGKKTHFAASHSDSQNYRWSLSLRALSTTVVGKHEGGQQRERDTDLRGRGVSNRAFVDVGGWGSRNGKTHRGDCTSTREAPEWGTDAGEALLLL
ncbi:hypothetical protein B0H12DRAFT_1159107, partial [Mycena haematopus]